MRKVFWFMMVSVDGYFEGPNHDISWHNADNDEFVQFAIEQTSQVGTMLFGHRTYDMMANFWPSDEALRTDPDTAKLMNEAEKVVFAHDTIPIDWQNSHQAVRSLADEVRALKAESGKDIAVFGSNNLAVQLFEADLLDEIRIITSPIALGVGTSLFAGLAHPAPLQLMKTRTFDSGNVLLTYTPTH